MQETSIKIFLIAWKDFQYIGYVIIMCYAAYVFLLNNCKFIIMLKFPVSDWQFILCNTLQELIYLLLMLCDILIMSLSFSYKVKLVVTETYDFLTLNSVLLTEIMQY